jgi:hypothetical protein
MLSPRMLGHRSRLTDSEKHLRHQLLRGHWTRQALERLEAHDAELPLELVLLIRIKLRGLRLEERKRSIHD